MSLRSIISIHEGVKSALNSADFAVGLSLLQNIMLY
jgi:hypothetical protein